MRPSLQRLLARPSSLEFLGLLVGRPTLYHDVRRDRREKRGSAALAYAVSERGSEERDVKIGVRGDNVSNHDQTRSRTAKQSRYNALPTARSLESSKHAIAPPNYILQPSKHLDQWSSKLYKKEELEFQSDITNSDNSRLLSQPAYAFDIELWAHLLEYRYSQYGDQGVMMFWKYIFKNGIRIPTKGNYADKLWYTLLNLDYDKLPFGFLEKICTYTDLLYEIHNARWAPSFNLQIMQYFLVVGKHDEALYWHKRLFKNHRLGRRSFLRLFHEVIEKNGNERALRQIYADGAYGKCYDMIIFRLCIRGKYQVALEWHFWLLQQKDLPSSPASIESLLKHLATHAPNSAAKVAYSLQAEGIAWEIALPDQETRITPKTSVDIISEVRSKTFHVTEKSYNDSLGARWLATGWVGLTTAIETLNALGIREIGPLSLQAVAMRERKTAAIASRLEQLAALNISIGSSCYSLAIAQFARNNKQELLDLLLESDQHPSELEDVKLQERLLSHYAQSQEWKLFRLTLETLSVKSHDPEVQKRNIVFCLNLADNTAATYDSIKENVNDMIHDGVPIKYNTIVKIKKALLSPRRKGHRPDTHTLSDPRMELASCISILEQIIEANNEVRVNLWSELVRRLGMLRQWEALESVCLKIAKWYAPHSIQLSLAGVSAEIPTNNPNHPLRLFFDGSLQMAIVEWGFMQAIDGQIPPPDSSKSFTTINSGVRLLEKLAQCGVWIDHDSIKNAILNRMLIYYGPGQSMRKYNNAARERLDVEMFELVGLIEYDFDGHKLEIEQVREFMRKHEGQKMRRRDHTGIRRNTRSVGRYGVYRSLH